MEARVQHWDPAWGPLSEDSMRRKLEEEGYRVSKYRYEPGTFFTEHTHALHKKDAVLAGRLRIETHDGDVVLGPGDMIEIPSGVEHTAEVEGDETVVSLDATKVAR